MSIFPDPSAIRAIAHRIALQAEAARTRATALDGALAAVDWHGVAAGAFHTLAHPVIGALRISATDLDHAAQALRSLATNVEATLDDLRRAGLDVLATRDDLMTALRDGTDPHTLIYHPEVLALDGIKLSKDGLHLLGDGANLAGDFADGIEGGVVKGLNSLRSFAGI